MFHVFGLSSLLFFSHQSVSVFFPSLVGSILTKVVIQITAAHICYLVAEANFEPYSDSARMCLVGADHWKFPRTYASPEAIQVFNIVLYLVFKDIYQILF